MPLLCDCYHCPSCRLTDSYAGHDFCEDYRLPLCSARRFCQEEREMFMQEIRA